MALAPAGRPVPTALCPRCGAPLIGTFAWSKFEFYCLECAGHYDWLEPVEGDSATHAEQLAALTAEWEEHAGRKLLAPHAWHTGCEQCAPRVEPHIAHATPLEILEDSNARRWLIDRAGMAR